MLLDVLIIKVLEKELHKKFKEFKIPQIGYFKLSKYKIVQVNIKMTIRSRFLIIDSLSKLECITHLFF